MVPQFGFSWYIDEYIVIFKHTLVRILLLVIVIGMSVDDSFFFFLSFCKMIELVKKVGQVSKLRIECGDGGQTPNTNEVTMTSTVFIRDSGFYEALN